MNDELSPAEEAALIVRSWVPEDYSRRPSEDSHIIEQIYEALYGKPLNRSTR